MQLHHDGVYICRLEGKYSLPILSSLLTRAWKVDKYTMAKATSDESGDQATTERASKDDVSRGDEKVGGPMETPAVEKL